MTATVAGIHLGIDTHANRPAANTVPDGSLYSCSTHNLVYKSNLAGNSWATWANLAGTGLTDPMTTRGDMIYRNASNVTDRLGIPAAGQVIGRSGSDLAAVYPPGYLIDSASATSGVTVSGTTEGSPTSVLSGNSVTYDGGVVRVEFTSSHWGPDNAAAGRDIRLYFKIDSTSQGIVALAQQTATGTQIAYTPLCAVEYYTPSAGAHTISVTASRTGADGVISAGAGGSGAVRPMRLRITKV